MPDWKRNMYLLWCGMFINGMAATLSTPFYPLFLRQDLGVHRHVETWAGIAISISFLVSGLCAPFWGSLADRFGSKPMLIRSGIGLGLAYIANVFVFDLISFLAVRVFQGIMAGFYPASMTLVGTNTPEKHVGYALGIMSTSTAAGSIVGPLAGGLVSQWIGLRGCFVLSGVFMILSALIVFGVREAQRRREAARTSVQQDLRQAAKTPMLLRIYAIIAVVTVSTYMLEPLLSLYVVELGADESNAMLSSGIAFSAVGLATVLTGAFWGKMGGRWGFGRTLIVGLAGGGIGSLLQLFVPGVAAFTGLRFGYGLFYAAVFPALNALIVQFVDSEFRGRAVSLSQSANMLGFVLGPLLGGILGGAFGIPLVFALTGAVLLGASWFIHASRFDRKTAKSIGTAGRNS
ncbi:MFS transporter [Cohnella fermenti]|uniref:Multidrug efflux MFS transporter n=1 Tax=Cohnella fermenti TaxID=2565925 RepID=A0A4S4BKT1_9BACL|nr:MFS transporter [Cohnella fermenti]THF75343.1 multidrug efflux MFS transporter [Cohnella fermenti]